MCKNDELEFRGNEVQKISSSLTQGLTAEKEYKSFRGLVNNSETVFTI